MISGFSLNWKDGVPLQSLFRDERFIVLWFKTSASGETNIIGGPKSCGRPSIGAAPIALCCPTLSYRAADYDGSYGKGDITPKKNQITFDSETLSLLVMPQKGQQGLKNSKTR